jgi:replication factor C large subunit
MSGSGQPWAAKFRPRTVKELPDNEVAIGEFIRWIKSWEQGTPEKRAAFLYGPPGVGKTATVVAVANDFEFDLLEINASDTRTGRRLNEVVGRAAAQSLTVFGRRRMILLDELEGVSGREDEGGIATIASIIKETRSPVVLVATSATEGWEEKFSPLREISLQIEFGPIPFADVVSRLKSIANEVDVQVDDEAMELIAERSKGDMRSAINDFEAVARGKQHVSAADVDWLGERDRQAYTPEVLSRIFSAKTVREARQALSSAFITYDDLFEWINENLPLVLDDPVDLDEGIEALARADVHEGRSKRTQEFRLLKYMFNEMTGGVAVSRHLSEGSVALKQIRSRLDSIGGLPSAFTVSETPDGFVVRPVRYLGNDWGRVNSALKGLGGSWARGGGFWVIPYFRPPQSVWRYRATWHSRRMRKGVAERVAAKCHVSTAEAIREVIPLIKVMIEDGKMGDEIARWLGLEDNEIKWLRS